MSSHDKISDSAFSTPSGGVEVDTTSSLILWANGDDRYFPKITPSDYNSYRAQLSELSMATAQLNLNFPCCWESKLDKKPDIVARLCRVDAMSTTFVSKHYGRGLATPRSDETFGIRATPGFHRKETTSSINVLL